MDQNKKIEDIFEDIIFNKRWSKKDLCGPGSSISYTEKLRGQLPDLLHRYKISSMFDIPCGDFSWMQYVNLEGIEYLGGDIVEKLIETNKKNYPKYNFKKIDIINDSLPDSDLIFVKDCLLHLSNMHIKKTLQNICRSNIKFLLMTNWLEDYDNFRDIETGQGRLLNFLVEPYNFPLPLDIIVEKNPKISLNLWKIDDLRQLNFINIG